MNIEKLVKQVNNCLKNSEDHKEKVIDLILYNEENHQYNIYVGGDGSVGFLEFKNNELSDCNNFFDWDYSVDKYIFDDLESGYDIAYVTDETHSGIWFEMDTYCIEDIEHKEGFEKYINYCKENDITKEYIDANVVGNPTPNIFDNKHLFPDDLER